MKTLFLFIFQLVNQKFVSPLDASGTLLSQTVHQSEIGGMVLSKTGTGGTSTIQKKLLIDKMPAEAPDEEGDAIEDIDNNEKGGKTYSVKKNSQMQMSLVTARMKIM